MPARKGILRRRQLRHTHAERLQKSDRLLKISFYKILYMQIIQYTPSYFNLENPLLLFKRQYATIIFATQPKGD